MADAKLLNLAKIQARLAAVPKAAEEALRRQLKTEADDLVDAIKGAMAAQYDTTDHGHQSLIDSVHAYENPDREISYRILARRQGRRRQVHRGQRRARPQGAGRLARRRSTCFLADLSRPQEGDETTAVQGRARRCETILRGELTWLK